MKFDKTKDFTRDFTDEFDLYRLLRYKAESGEEIQAFVSFTDKVVNYKVSLPGTIMELKGTAREDGLHFSFNNIELAPMNSTRDLDSFIDEMKRIRSVCAIIESVEKENPLWSISGPWTKDAVKEVSCYVQSVLSCSGRD